MSREDNADKAIDGIVEVRASETVALSEPVR
jgi:hypothetical protein